MAGVDAVIAPRQQPQALRGLVDQIGLGQDAAADRDHRIGGEDEGAAQLVVELHGFERRVGLGARQAIGAGARQLAPLRGLVDIGRAQRVGLDAGLVEQAEPSRRTGSENDFGTAEHAGFVRDFGIGRGRARGTYRKALHSTTGEQVVVEASLSRSSLRKQGPMNHEARCHGNSHSGWRIEHFLQAPHGRGVWVPAFAGTT